MKTFVSFVIQDKNGHKHESAIITSHNPSYSYSANPPVSDVMDWVNKKKQELQNEEELVIVGMYKL